MNIKTQKVKQIKLCNTKVEWCMFGKNNKDFYKCIVDVEVGNNKIPVSLNYTGSQNEYMLNNFDREVYSSIVSLYLTGNKYITYSMIFNVLSGNDSKLKISNNNLKLISRSVNKMYETEIIIEKSERTKNFEYNGKLLQIEFQQDYIELNGHEVEECFYIKEKEALPLLTLADNMNQISTVMINLLNMRDKSGKIKLEINYENVILKYFLLRRILNSNNKKSKMKKVILFDSLYEHINLEKYSGDQLRHKRKRILDNLQKCFECWEDMKLITGFEIDKEARKINWTNLL